MTVQFAPWTSDIELSFFSALAARKINFDKLDDAARKVLGRYEIRPNDPSERSARMQIYGNAFSTDELSSDFYRAEGMLKNVNTIEEYRSLNHNAIIERAGRTIWDAIVDGTIFSCPSLLSSFYAIFFADLKKYKFTYHFAFPALHSQPPWSLAEDDPRARSKLEPTESRLLHDVVQTWKYSVDPRQYGFFLAKRDRSPAAPEAPPTHAQDSSLQDSETAPKNTKSPGTPTAAFAEFQWRVASLAAYEAGFFDGVPSSDCFICFVDPSTYPDNPSWPLRNLLMLVKYRWELNDIQILCYRDKHSTREHSNSVILHLVPGDETSSEANAISETTHTSKLGLKDMPMPKVTGWERAPSRKLSAMTTDLSAYLDPSKLADQAVDLNLKLMKWRIAPSLDLNSIQSTKCLLLGAGTLGSYVARNLLGWGVRHVTFVDNGKVSFSNPVRQPLFRFEDCKDGGRAKAERAAEALREIYPGAKTGGLTLSVPMAGHPIIREDGDARVRAEFIQLKELVAAHDAIFLLMDTRESRWLPTLMGKSMGKIVINAALGFDTYVVMRHGIPADQAPRSQQQDSKTQDRTSPHPQAETSTAAGEGEELGCYFCNDVVAPTDSIKDQTLDQQCTVTRPGIAAIASALAVELLVSVIQHPLRGRAPAPASRQAGRDTLVPATPTNADSTNTSQSVQHPLGLVPHSIRGFLSSWDNLLTRGPAYSACSACSPAILERYKREDWDFVKRAISEPGWIEEVSGLKEVQRKAEEAAKMLEEENDFEIEEEGDGDLLQ